MNDVDGKSIGSALALRRRGGLSPEAKVAVAIYMLLALLTASVLLAVVLIVGVKDNSTQLIDRQLQYAVAIDEAALYAKSMANDERGFLISGRKEFLVQLEERAQKVRASFATALSQASGSAERAAVERARAGFESWLAELRIVLERFQDGDRGGAVTTSLGRTRDLRKAYEASLADADARAAGGIEAARNSVAATSSRYSMFLLVYLVGALAVGFGIAMWILSSRPETRRLT